MKNIITNSTNPIVRKALNAAKTVKNAAYSSALKYILDSVKPYMDKRIKGDSSWRYPMLVITVLRKVCDKAIMSAGRYDGKRPPHRIYDIECVKDGFKFQGNLIITGLLHRDDPDDVSAFDEYDMTLSLMNVGKATNAVNAVASKSKIKVAQNAEYVVRRSLSTSKWILSRKAASLGDKGDDKIFATEQEARDYAKKNGLKVVNAACKNDKWIDDFHVIVTAEKPDPALVDALKKKAAAWKAYKRNLSDKAADEAHEKAKHDVATVAKRLGAKLEQMGAVLRVIMPNTATNAVVHKAMNACRANSLVAKNWNYSNKYPFFVVDPSLAKPCIYSGWDFREDAGDDLKELKEIGRTAKILSRRFLEQNGIDPNDGAWWKKNR